MSDDGPERTCAAIAAQVHEFYEHHPYPPPADDLDAYRRAWNDNRRRAESFLFWPGERYRDDRSMLVAGCGTMQAAHYAVRWPRARVVGIDVGANSIAFAKRLKADHGLHNLELRELAVENVGQLGERFDHVVCTGVLHHLPDPGAGLRALREVLAPGGALHLMVYAPYGRAGIYMLQEYCRQLGIAPNDEEIANLAASLRALPLDHPIVPLLRNSPDFASTAGLADALLHPNDRAYAVPEFVELLEGAGFVFGRWIRQAPYLAACGAIASTPHASRLAAMPLRMQYAAMELFRGTMVRHSAIGYAADSTVRKPAIDLDGDAWLRLIPLRLPDTIVVREKLPPGCVAVAINRNHTDTDLYLPLDAAQEGLLSAIDGHRTAGEIYRHVGRPAYAQAFFQRLWLWDQIVFGR